MLRLFGVALCAALLVCLAPATATFAQTSGDLTIVLDGPGAVSGTLANVPADATAVDVTITSSDGGTQTVTTTADQGWRFQFNGLTGNGPWIQIAALASTGMGASVANNGGGGLATASAGTPAPGDIGYASNQPFYVASNPAPAYGGTVVSPSASYGWPYNGYTYGTPYYGATNGYSYGSSYSGTPYYGTPYYSAWNGYPMYNNGYYGMPYYGVPPVPYLP